MKKFVIGATGVALFIATGVRADEDHFNHWQITSEFVTLNPQVPDRFSDLDVGMKAAMQYNFNPNWYASASALRGHKDRWTWSATLGLQSSTGYVRPYAEANFNDIARIDQSHLQTIGYDVGASLNVSPYFVPYAEVDNFMQKQKEAVQVGVGIPLPHNITLGATYAWEIQDKNNGANVKLSYAF